MNLTDEEKEALRIFHADKEYMARLNREAAESNRLREEMTLPYKERTCVEICEDFYVQQERKDQLNFSFSRDYDQGSHFSIDLTKEDCIKLLPFIQNFINVEL